MVKLLTQIANIPDITRNWNSLFLRLEPGLHETFLHRFSRRFKLSWMDSYGDVHTWYNKMSKKIKGATDKNGLKIPYYSSLLWKKTVTFGVKIQYSFITHLDEFLFLFVIRCAVRRTEHRRHHRLQRLLQVFGVLTRTKTSQMLWKFY